MIWSRKFRLLNGISGDVGWKDLKALSPFLIICTDLGNKFFGINEKIYVYSEYRLMFPEGENWVRKKIQNGNKSLLLFSEPVEKFEKHKILVTYNKFYSGKFGLLVCNSPEDSRLFCGEGDSKTYVSWLSRIYKSVDLEYNRWNEHFAGKWAP
jgi:hypothetical protein